MVLDKLPNTRLQRLLKRKGACYAARRWVGDKTAKEAWETCSEPAWLHWIALIMYPADRSINISDVSHECGVEHNYISEMGRVIANIKRKWCKKFRELVKRPKMTVAKGKVKA